MMIGNGIVRSLDKSFSIAINGSRFNSLLDKPDIKQ